MSFKNIINMHVYILLLLITNQNKIARMLLIFWNTKYIFGVRRNVNKIFPWLCFDFTTKWHHETTESTWREYVFCELITECKKIIYWWNFVFYKRNYFSELLKVTYFDSTIFPYKTEMSNFIFENIVCFWVLMCTLINSAAHASQIDQDIIKTHKKCEIKAFI